MLLDRFGKPIGKRKLAKMIIFGSVNCEEPWLPLERTQVPEWVQEPDVMGRMVKGTAANSGDNNVWYIAVPAPDETQAVH